MTSSRHTPPLAGLSRAQLFAGAAALLVVLTLVLRYLLLERTSINWDEFNFLHQIYLTAEGEQTRAVQTFHGRLLGWLTHWPGNEVDQILVGRHVMFAVLVLSICAWGFVGYRIIGGSAGLFAAFVAGSFAYALGHSTAFRFDPLMTACFAGAASTLLIERRPRLWAAVAGAFLGLGLAVSLKTMFFAPVLIILVAAPALDPERRRHALVRSAIFALAACATCAILLAVHSLDLADATGQTQTAVSAAAGKAIDLDNLVPQPIVLTASLAWDAPMWLLMAAGLAVLVGDMVRCGERRARIRALQVVAFAGPLLTLAFFRNSYPYYYPTILPGACLLAGYLWRSIERLRRPILAGALAVVCAAPVAWKALRWYGHNNSSQVAVQAHTVAAVHQVFAEPVPYIDRCGMIGSFDKVGPFMSTWVMSSYQQRGENIMVDLLRDQQPVFILANSPGLELWRRWQQVPPHYRFLPGDYQALRQNFIPHWGPILIAGKIFKLPAGETVAFDIVIAGPYTVEAAAPVVIDGTTHSPGDVVALEAGKHHARAGDGAEQLVLRYGDHLPRPADRPIAAPIFQPFSLGRP